MSLSDFPGGSDGEESVCNAGDSGSIPGLGNPLEKGMATHSSIQAWRIPANTLHDVVPSSTRVLQKTALWRALPSTVSSSRRGPPCALHSFPPPPCLLIWAQPSPEPWVGPCLNPGARSPATCSRPIGIPPVEVSLEPETRTGLGMELKLGEAEKLHPVLLGV